jgi:acetyl/propionyl-CoA carboxylase alpha subunit
VSAPPFRRVLVANRGEIAVRIIRACHELGSEAVAVYSDADADARHVREADVAIRIGPAAPADSYLRAEVLIAAARAARAEAIHPGYGFLSERAEFAEACEDAGIVFVGPDRATLAGLADKLAARRAAVTAGVPVVPGTLEPVQFEPQGEMREAIAEGDRIGWPVLVKAAGGGGGRGMRRVNGASDLSVALAAASREALAAFGDPSVYLERVVLGARHVEVQLLGDADHNVVALGERDCTVQRRYQKLVEEAPAPGLTSEARERLHARGVAVARAVGLRNAATAEFLLEPSGDAWFLEVNARLQVEHGVTELVSGVDLVQAQLRVAAGERLWDRLLSASARLRNPERHAIEVRVSAEDPGNGFAPTAGTIRSWEEPGGPGVRVDTGFGPGSRVGTDYDPLLAKLMVEAEDRPGALARLRRALDEFRVTGLQTTLPFHAWLVRSEWFRKGEIATDFVDRNWRPDEAREEAARRAAQVAALSHLTAGGDAGASMKADGRSGERWQQAARREATERWPA